MDRIVGQSTSNSRITTDSPTRPGERDVETNSLDAQVDASVDTIASLEPDLSPSAIQIEDLCEGVDCGEHGACEAQEDLATCICDSQYVAQALDCIPEDRDQDGVHFLDDCRDDNAMIYPEARERCDQVDQDCDGIIDEGACSIWVLEPRANQWRSYALDVGGNEHLPVGPIKAAWDIESLDLGFVLTETNYHALRMSSLTWESTGALDDLFTGHGGSISAGASAYSVPHDHFMVNDYETITISLVDISGVMRVWVLKYMLNTRQHERYGVNSLYGDVHTWDDANAPVRLDIRASWLDIYNARGWSTANPSELCGQSAMASDPYSAILSSTHLYVMETGYCFLFLPPIPLLNSPLDLPGAPQFGEIGAAMWHQGSLYLFRGD